MKEKAICHKKFLQCVELYNHKLHLPKYYRAWMRLCFISAPPLSPLRMSLRIFVKTVSNIPLPGRSQRCSRIHDYYESHEQAKVKLAQSSQDVILLYGFSRSGTSYLQNHLSVYFRNSSLVLQDGKIWSHLASLKHTQEFYDAAIRQCGGCIKVVIPLRNAFDAITSWCVYDPGMLNQDKINEALVWYKSMLDFVERNSTSASVIPVSFEAIKVMKPLVLANAISAISMCALSSHENLDYLSLFKKTNLGDSTGYSSEESIGTPIKSHIPNNLKNQIAPLIAVELKKMVDEKLLMKLEKRRQKIINDGYCVHSN